MPEAILKMLSRLGLRCLLLAACSASPDRPDGGAQDTGSGRTEAFANDATALAGKGDMVTQEAVLRRADGGDEIVVRARGGNSRHFPSCFLTEGTMEEADKRVQRALEEASKRGETAPEARVDSLWPKEMGGEMSVKGGAFVIVFHEDPNPPEEVADPRRTPFFVHCGGGDTFKEVTNDSAHVQGTPKSP